MKSQHAKQRACVIVVGLFSTLAGLAQAGETPIGAPQDWSSRAVVYRQPLTPDELIARGRSAEMNRLYRDPRYVASVLRRVEAEGRRPALPVQGIRNPHEDRHRPRGSNKTDVVSKDWSNVLGSVNGGTGMEGTYPAKYNFDITKAPSCANDFLVYPTNAPGANSSGTAENRNGTFSSRPGNGDTITIGTAPRSVTLTAANTATTNLQWARGGSGGNAASRAATNSANLAAVADLWKSQTGISATDLGSGVVKFSQVGNGNDASNLPIDVSNIINFTTGNVTNGTGTAGQPTIIAFNQLYQGAGACNGTWNGNGAVKAPSEMWAYNTGTGYSSETSPSLSYLDDGKQIAFVQRNSTVLQLVLLKWKEGQGTAAAPATPDNTYTSANAAAYRTCANDIANPKSCAISFDLQTTDNGVTWSSPFVDYTNDTLWVGDTTGHLHKFTGVFQGTPTRATAVAGITVENGMKLGSPTSDGTNVYVGSQSGGAGIGGKLHRIDIASGTVFSSAKLANNNTIGLREGPIVDTGTGSVIAFLFNDGTAGNTTDCGPTSGNNNACRVITRFATGFAAAANPLQRVYVGRGNNVVSTLFAGAFDDDYYTSSNGSGAMYIVGGDPLDTFIPTLWKIPLNNGVFGAPIKGPVVGSKSCTQACIDTDVFNWSPVTVVKTDATNEYLYFSMDKRASFTGCAGACLYMVNLTSSVWGTAKTASAYIALPTDTGTSGIVVDNVNNSTTGARQVYFSNTGSTGNAVQASQDALN